MNSEPEQVGRVNRSAVEGQAMSTEVKALRAQLMSIGKHASEARNEHVINLSLEAISFLVAYTSARIDFQRIMRKEHINVDLWDLAEIYPVKNVDALSAENMLRHIEIQCDKGAEALADIIISIPKEELDKLDSLRKELRELSYSLTDVNYETNFVQAIDECEKRHWLASALISSRVIAHALDNLPGDNMENKVKSLEEKNILDKKGKDVGEFILKASKKARNYFSHDIKAFPDPSDAISLLGDTIAILRIIVKLEEASKT
jgi:hypothetical protein